MILLSTTAAVTATTFNPADKDPSITLSGGNLIATGNVGISQNFVRTIASHASGLYYIEYKATSLGGGNTSAGLAVAAASAANSNDAMNICVYYSGSGNIYINGSTPGAIGSAAANDVIGVAVNVGSSLVWFRRNSGNWNNSGTAVPGTPGSGGFSTSALTTALFGWVSCNGGAAGVQWTANFGGSAYANAAPSGFGAF